MSSNVFNDSTALISINDFDDMCVELIHKPNFLLRVAFDDVDNDVIEDEGGLHATEDEIRIIEEKYQQKMLTGRQEMLQEEMNKNSDLQKYATADIESGQITINWDEINAVTDEE